MKRSIKNRKKKGNKEKSDKKDKKEKKEKKQQIRKCDDEEDTEHDSDSTQVYYMSRVCIFGYTKKNRSAGVRFI